MAGDFGIGAVVGGLVNWADNEWGTGKTNREFQSAEAQKQRDWAAEQTSIMNDWNQKNLDITREREDNAVERRAADLAKTGLNPLLAVGNPAAAANATTGAGPGGAAASGGQAVASDRGFGGQYDITGAMARTAQANNLRQDTVLKSLEASKQMASVDDLAANRSVWAQNQLNALRQQEKNIALTGEKTRGESASADITEAERDRIDAAQGDLTAELIARAKAGVVAANVESEFARSAAAADVAKDEAAAVLSDSEAELNQFRQHLVSEQAAAAAADAALTSSQTLAQDIDNIRNNATTFTSSQAKGVVERTLSAIELLSNKYGGALGLPHTPNWTERR